MLAIARIVENVIRATHRFAHRHKRDPDRAEWLSMTDSVLDLTSTGTRPSRATARKQGAAWVQLELQLLEGEDREVVVLRQWEGQVGEVLREVTGGASAPDPRRP